MESILDKGQSLVSQNASCLLWVSLAFSSVVSTLQSLLCHSPAKTSGRLPDSCSAASAATGHFHHFTRVPQVTSVDCSLTIMFPNVVMPNLAIPCSLKDQAPPHLVITHYTELLEDKGLVLAKADAISPHLISVAEVNVCSC